MPAEHRIATDHIFCLLPVLFIYVVGLHAFYKDVIKQMSNSVSVKKPLFIPYWIKQLLIRNQLPLTAAMDLSALRKVASIEDLVLTLCMNLNTTPILGYMSSESCLFTHWLKDTDSERIYNQLYQLKELHESGLEARLYNQVNAHPQLSLPYEILDVSSDVFLIVINPGFFGSPKGAEYQRQLVSDYLKQWYGYNNYDTIAQSQFFEQYLKQL
ncbi:MAG: hypothetical protein PHQ58_04865 [Rhodoferax sp.]|uniref:hypothetical protein n=1 Tax=Rhodoferax sp. TaxID=50421 RepID=UPI0026293F23|nr:hypothetical protein [Rhodoferax sp.]MDD2879745.1 hypothetical protein [Rhodoferax sp.]